MDLQSHLPHKPEQIGIRKSKNINRMDSAICFFIDKVFSQKTLLKAATEDYP